MRNIVFISLSALLLSSCAPMMVSGSLDGDRYYPRGPQFAGRFSFDPYMNDTHMTYDTFTPDGSVGKVVYKGFSGTVVLHFSQGYESVDDFAQHYILLKKKREIALYDDRHMTHKDLPVRILTTREESTFVPTQGQFTTFLVFKKANTIYAIERQYSAYDKPKDDELIAPVLNLYDLNTFN